MIVVTIKLPKNPNHNPHKKVVGPCPFTDRCTDSTGEHHTAVVYSEREVDTIRDHFKHITRIEYF